MRSTHVLPEPLQSLDFVRSRSLASSRALEAVVHLQLLAEPPHKRTDAGAVLLPCLDLPRLSVKPYPQTFLQSFSFELPFALYQRTGHSYTPYEVPRAPIYLAALLRQYVRRYQGR